MMEINSIYNLETLQTHINQGYHPKYLFFWGHTPQQPGQVDKACLSQWYPASFEVAGLVYPTAEHYMMAEKARLFGDETRHHQIMTAKNPAQAKKYGRMVTGFDEVTWAEHRFEIVTQGNLAKFSQNKALGDFLRTTTQRILVEASPLDCIWGIGLAADDPKASDPTQWRGLNLLGFALMQVRSEL